MFVLSYTFGALVTPVRDVLMLLALRALTAMKVNEEEEEGTEN